jgi:hypothetical protein
MANPDAKEFAKAVLWHLACLRTDLIKTQLLVMQIQAVQHKIPVKQIQARWKRETETMRRKLYREALRAARLIDE